MSTLAGLANDPVAPPFVMVTHHVDEIPPGVTHAALMSAGRIDVQGPISEVLTAERLSRCFDTPLRLERRADGRFAAWGR